MPADASDAPPTAAADAPGEARATAPAATVLEDRLEVIASDTSKRERRVWTVRIDDPARVTAGLVVPDGLDGATNKGARVFERLLNLPPNVAPGDTFVLEKTTTDSSGPQSGVFLTTPDLPVEKATVVIRSSSKHLSVWVDDDAQASYSRGEGRVATLTWTAVPTSDPAQVVWTTWRDWLQAGHKLEAQVAPKMAAKRESLGRTLGADVSGLTPAQAVDRVNADIRHAEGGVERWSAARSVNQVAAAREGSAVERGLVLINLLRWAGYDARPAYYRSASSAGEVPMAVPAPAMFDRPVVAVILPGRTVWIDPANERVRPPDMPAAMYGSPVWVPGDMPFQLGATGVVDGVLSISASYNLAPDGSATWTASVTASGMAQEALRARLAGVQSPEREALFRRMAGVRGRAPDRFGFQASGIDDIHKPLQITLQGHDAAALAKFGERGLDGSLAPVLAPAMAAWLPPRILVQEDLSVTPPAGLVPVSVAADAPPFHADATLGRTWRREGARMVITTLVERPYRQTSAERDSSAERYLHAQAAAGPSLLLIPPPSPEIVRAIGKTTGTRPPAEMAVLEAVLWWTHNELPKRAAKAMARAVEIGTADDLARYLDRHAPPGDNRAWLALFDQARVEEQRLAAVEGLARHGWRREAWMRAALLTASPDPATRVRALLAQEKYEEAKPDPIKDPDAAALWKEPATLLEEARALAATLPGAKPAGDPRVLMRQAERAITEGRAADAEVLLETVLGFGSDPVATVLLAEASVSAGLPEDDIVARVEEAVAAAPSDPEVIRRAARTMTAIGRKDRALHWSLQAARIAGANADAWGGVVDPALSAGDLATALFAARRASDLAPGSAPHGEKLALVATLARDQDAAMLGAARNAGKAPLPEWKPDLQTLMGIAPDHGLLALLNFHDADVIVTPSALSLRAQLRLDAGQLEGAARDGTLLSLEHGQPRGGAIAFAATAGRLWSNARVEALDDAAERDLVARTLRMEYRVITGGDATGDARQLRDDPRAQIILGAATAHEVEGQEVPGWPKGLPEPSNKAPSGFVSNRVLGAPRGVAAWSDRERAIAFMRTSRVTGTLPPPLALLYTPGALPVRRLEGGGQVIRLEGGPIPLYAAIRIDGDQEVTGIGYTPVAATHALQAATGR
jgi:hypothetical protein